LEEIVTECLQITQALHIPVSTDTPVQYNGRIRRKWGYCKRLPNGTFEISVARVLGEEDVPKKTLMSTILHELLHTCPGCFNHDKLWKSYGKAIKKAYGIKIRTTSDAEDMKVESCYYIKCRACKEKIWYPMKPVNRKQQCPVCGSEKLSCFYKKNEEKIKIWKR